MGTTQNGTDKLKLNFDYGTSANNGNVLSQTILVPAAGTANPGFKAVQTYTYDQLNRIQDAKENINDSSTPEWKQTFKYDRYGNRRFNTDNNNTTTFEASCPTAICNPEVSPSNNRLVGYSFDNAGNTTRDANGKKFTYDGENKQVKAEIVDQYGNPVSTIGEYWYDGDGKRVKKIGLIEGEWEETIFVYDASSRLVAEYSNVVEPAATATVSYLTNDHLGSPRITTNKDGGVISRRDFMPFGEEISTSQRMARTDYAGDKVRQKFTSYERDNESDLDFAQARMYKYSHGRFTSPDPLLSSGRIEDPQTWNRYAYVLNNPLYYIDPDGLYECTGTKEQCSEFRTALANAKAKLASIEKQYTKNSDEYRKAERALNSYGCESKGGNCIDANGKNVTDADGKVIKDTSNIAVDFNLKGQGARTSLNGKTINISFDKSFGYGDPFMQGVIGNEGSNAADIQDFTNTGKVITRYESEYNSSFVQAVINEFVARNDYNYAYYSFKIDPTKGRSRNIQVWNEGWVTPDLKTLRANRQNNINTFLKEDKKYLLTPTNRAGKQPIDQFIRGK